MLTSNVAEMVANAKCWQDCFSFQIFLLLDVPNGWTTYDVSVSRSINLARL
jgi:hypothetical protein